MSHVDASTALGALIVEWKDFYFGRGCWRRWYKTKVGQKTHTRNYTFFSFSFHEVGPMKNDRSIKKHTQKNNDYSLLLFAYSRHFIGNTFYYIVREVGQWQVEQKTHQQTLQTYMKRLFFFNWWDKRRVGQDILQEVSSKNEGFLLVFAEKSSKSEVRPVKVSQTQEFPKVFPPPKIKFPDICLLPWIWHAQIWSCGSVGPGFGVFDFRSSFNLFKLLIRRTSKSAKGLRNGSCFRNIVF